MNTEKEGKKEKDLGNSVNDREAKIRKTKTKVHKHNNSKSLKDSIKNSDETNSKRKVKFGHKVEIIDVECWKAYNLEQTAEENIEAFFYDDNDIKANIKTDKRKDRKGNVSCTCNII